MAVIGSRKEPSFAPSLFLSHAGSQTTAHLYHMPFNRRRATMVFHLSEASTRGSSSMLQPGNRGSHRSRSMRWIRCRLTTLHLVDHSVIAYSIWPSHHRPLKLKYGQSSHLIEHSLAGPLHPANQHKGGVRGRPCCCPCEPRFHVSHA